MEPVLQVNGVSKHYGSLCALNNVTLSLPAGEIVGLLGPNGSGKTTLIKLIAGLLTPNSGELLVCGNPIGPKSKSMVSYLPDRIYFDQKQTVNELMEFYGDFYEDFDITQARTLLDDLGIDYKKRFSRLSKGTKEKVQLVLVMSRRAKLYLLDEPIAGVDPAARDYILNTIISNYNREATILISTHLIADVEPVLDSFFFVHNGQIVMNGSVAQQKEESGKTLDELFREVFRCLPSC